MNFNLGKYIGMVCFFVYVNGLDYRGHSSDFCLSASSK